MTDVDASQRADADGVAGRALDPAGQADPGRSTLVNKIKSTGYRFKARRQDAEAARRIRKDASAVEMDPLALGLMAALATSLSAAPAIAAPSHAPDAGVSNDRKDSQTRADLVPEGSDPAQDQQNDGPSTTGSVPSGEGSKQRPSEPAHRVIGSSTPPDIWQSGEAALDSWTPSRFDQVAAPARESFTAFSEQRSLTFGPFGLISAPSQAGTPVGPSASIPPSVVSPPLETTTPPQVDTGTPAEPPVTNPPASAGPVARNDGGYMVVKGQRTIQTTTLLANDTASAGAQLTIGGVFNAQHGVVTYDAASQSVTFTAAAGYRGNASFSYTVTDDAGRSAQANVSLFVIPDETVFSDATLPVTDSVNDANPVELGVKFFSAADGVISGLRFYKGAGNVGIHTASLWDDSGSLLATTTFDVETGSGWQQVSFSTPVVIRAGATYVASYHTSGFYAADGGYFSSPVTNGDLTAVGSVFAYGAGNIFPTSTYNASNYWVDVVYNRPPAAPDAQDDVLGVIGSRSTSFASTQLLANDLNPDGVPLTITSVDNALHGTLSFDALTQAVTFTPTQGYSGTAGFSYKVTNDLGVSATADVKFWVDGAQPASFYNASTIPPTMTVNDGRPVELGFKFESTVNGQVLGLRFYKSAENTGTHVGNLWSATGDLLATATFTNETANGWQEVQFLAPVSLTAGTTYVASYHSDGNYSADPGYFDNAHTNGVLIAPAGTAGSGNGLYAYGSSSLFPTNSFNATSYGVDVLFKANLTG